MITDKSQIVITCNQTNLYDKANCLTNVLTSLDELKTYSQTIIDSDASVLGSKARSALLQSRINSCTPVSYSGTFYGYNCPNGYDRDVMLQQRNENDVQYAKMLANIAYVDSTKPAIQTALNTTTTSSQYKSDKDTSVAITETAKQKAQNNMYLIIGLVLIVIAIIVTIFLTRKKKQSV